MYLDHWIEDERDSAEVRYWKAALRRLQVVFVLTSVVNVGVILILAAHIVVTGAY